MARLLRAGRASHPCPPTGFGGLPRKPDPGAPPALAPEHPPSNKAQTRREVGRLGGAAGAHFALRLTFDDEKIVRIVVVPGGGAEYV